MPLHISQRIGILDSKIPCLFGHHTMSSAYILRRGQHEIERGDCCRICGFMHNTSGEGWGKGFHPKLFIPPRPSTLKQKLNWIFRGKIVYHAESRFTMPFWAT